jgi:6-pyruvoyltetrahydropterin/6-carboxytetrahydropterin synthase
MTFTLKFERRFSMAHRLLSGKSKKCSIPHGHNEFVKVSLQCVTPNKLDLHTNMLTDFSSAKSRWHKFIDDYLDHSFQLRDDDPLLTYFKHNEPEQLARIVVVPGDPTTEMLAACLMSKLDNLLTHENSGLVCSEFELEETPTNTVILSGTKSYENHLPKGDHWWNRNDFSINAF